MVLIFDPLDGLTEDETTALKAYADAGRSLFIVTTPDGTQLTPSLSPCWRNIRYVGGSEASRRSPHLSSPTDTPLTTVKVLSDAKTVMVWRGHPPLMLRLKRRANIRYSSEHPAPLSRTVIRAMYERRREGTGV